MKHLFYTLSLFLVICTISGCDNYDLMLSEKKLNRNIQRTWKYVIPGPEDGHPQEIWKFENGTVSLYNGDTITITGKYSVDARFSHAYVTLSDFKFTNYTVNSKLQDIDINRRWDLVELDNPVFYLSTTNNRGTLISLEFIEK